MPLFGKFWDSIAPLSPSPSSSKEIRADAERSAQIDNYIANLILAGEPGLAIALIRSGATVHAAGYGLANVSASVPIAPDTIFHMGSCSKQFTGLGILMLAEEGKLALDDPINRHLPELAKFDSRVTIRHLLHHTSGIRDLYDEVGLQEVQRRCERPANDDVIRTYAELGCPMSRLGIKPGDECSYSNCGYDFLGTVIERLSGQSYHDFFQDRVFDRLGMKDTFSLPDDRRYDRRTAIGYRFDDNGTLYDCGSTDFDDLCGAGSMYTTVCDMCLYDAALANNALVSASSMQQALTSGYTNDGQPTYYGFGWYLGVDEGEPYADHQGECIGYYAYIARYLQKPLSMYILSNNPNANIVDLATFAAGVYR